MLSPGPSKRLETRPGRFQDTLSNTPGGGGLRPPPPGVSAGVSGSFPAAFRATLRVPARAPPQKSKGLPSTTKGLRVVLLVVIFGFQLGSLAMEAWNFAGPFGPLQLSIWRLSGPHRALWRCFFSSIHDSRQLCVPHLGPIFGHFGLLFLTMHVGREYLSACS